MKKLTTFFPHSFRIVTPPHPPSDIFFLTYFKVTSKRFVAAGFETFKGIVKKCTEMYIYVVEELDKNICKFPAQFI